MWTSGDTLAFTRKAIVATVIRFGSRPDGERISAYKRRAASDWAALVAPPRGTRGVSTDEFARLWGSLVMDPVEGD
jgi:hypothetical protein